MSSQGAAANDEGNILAQIKMLSGQSIEQRRRRGRISQESLAFDVGITERWLREIEGGSPKPSLDDHLRCAAGVGLTAGYIFIPLLFMEKKMHFPKDVLGAHLAELETSCIEVLKQAVLRLWSISGPSPDGRRR